MADNETPTPAPDATPDPDATPTPAKTADQLALDQLLEDELSKDELDKFLEEHFAKEEKEKAKSTKKRDKTGKKIAVTLLEEHDADSINFGKIPPNPEFLKLQAEQERIQKLKQSNWYDTEQTARDLLQANPNYVLVNFKSYLKYPWGKKLFKDAARADQSTLNWETVIRDLKPLEQDLANLKQKRVDLLKEKDDITKLLEQDKLMLKNPENKPYLREIQTQIDGYERQLDFLRMALENVDRELADLGGPEADLSWTGIMAKVLEIQMPKKRKSRQATEQ